MSAINPVQARIEIFGEPTFFDDHFFAGWTPWQGTVSSDSDVETLTISPTYSAASMSRSKTFNSATYKYAHIRCTGFNGTAWKFQVRRADTSAWVNVITHTSTGLKKNIDISAAYSGNIDMIAIYLEGAAGNYVKIDYIAITKQTLLEPILSGEVVDEHTITRPILSQGVSGAQLTVTNFNGENTGKIKSHDVIVIWLARDSANLGDPAYKVFGGRVVNPTYKGAGYGNNFIHLDCHGHAYELINPPALVQKSYSAINGRTIIQEALALCAYLNYHQGDPTKWFDNTGSSGSTDDRINSTHDCEYDEVKPKTVIDEIAEKASNPAGVKGFDLYETPSGVLIGHLRNSLDFTSPIASITPETYSKSEDVHRVKNKQKVYGKAGKIGVPGDEGRKEPSDGDLWTLDDVNNWVADLGTLYSDVATPKVGSNNLRCFSFDSGADEEAKFRRDINNLVKGFGKSRYQTLNFYLKYNSVGNLTQAEVYLYAPDSSNYFKATLPDNLSSWTFQQLLLGQNQEYDAEKNPNGKWTRVGSPNWGNLTWLTFYFRQYSIYPFNIHLDGLYFGHACWRGSAEDASSQTSYGTREAEPELDEALGSDVECAAKALALIAFYKDPITSLENVLVDGDHRYTPGDRQRIIVSNDSLDAYYRILEVKHVLRGANWDTILKKSNEPVYIDYAFREITMTLSRLRRGR